MTKKNKKSNLYVFGIYADDMADLERKVQVFLSKLDVSDFISTSNIIEEIKIANQPILKILIFYKN